MTTPTPRTDAAVYWTASENECLPEVESVDAMFARQLERDLAAAQEALAKAEARAEASEKKQAQFGILLAETLVPGAYGIGSTLAQRITDAIAEGK